MIRGMELKPYEERGKDTLGLWSLPKGPHSSSCQGALLTPPPKKAVIKRKVVTFLLLEGTVPTPDLTSPPKVQNA